MGDVESKVFKTYIDRNKGMSVMLIEPQGSPEYSTKPWPPLQVSKTQVTPFFVTWVDCDQDTCNPQISFTELAKWKHCFLFFFASQKTEQIEGVLTVTTHSCGPFLWRTTFKTPTEKEQCA